MELFLQLLQAIIVQLWFKEINLSLIDWCFNDFKYDCGRSFWYFGSSVFKKNEY